MATKWTLSGDATDPHRIAAFWSATLGYVPEPGFEEGDVASIIDPAGEGPTISFLQVPEPKAAKNRLHIDIRVAGEGPRSADSERRMRAKVSDLVAAGATVVRDEYYGEALGHVVMLDPENNEFCVG